ncbi:hypothetical protein Tco_0442167 [Tanacetum coccineum]
MTDISRGQMIFKECIGSQYLCDEDSGGDSGLLGGGCGGVWAWRMARWWWVTVGGGQVNSFLTLLLDGA